jgi:hypothetical protein
MSADQPEPGAQPERKIIIDEDWKSQAQAEKEELLKKTSATESTLPESASLESASQETASGASTTPEDAAPAGASSAAEAAQRGPLPPPSLASLASMLAMQAMVSLGVVPNPLTGKAELDADQARHFIDTIEMLEQKTAGNRTAEESSILTGMLNELRMAYVGVTTQQSASSGEGGAPDGGLEPDS